MSVQYVGVQWNPRKITYDLVALVAVATYILGFTAIGRSVHLGDEMLSDPILAMRAWGSCAYLLLHVVLSIGPLARLSPRFAPLLYNRRHLGVLTFLVAAMHATHVLGFYFAYGVEPPAVALLTRDTTIDSLVLPFPLFGVIALAILFLMAITSHDFWQRLLGPKTWKWLHMSVYVAWALVVLHAAFGVLQYETHWAYGAGVLGLAAVVLGLHFVAARTSNALDRHTPRWVDLDGTRWLDAGDVDSFPEGRARPLFVPGRERIAIVRHERKISGIHGVCAHQGGPLYEGRVIDGCLTCPWHGWQYRPDDGCSPPPFTETLPIYQIRIERRRVLVDPEPHPAGTPLPAAYVEEGTP